MPKAIGFGYALFSIIAQVVLAFVRLKRGLNIGKTKPRFFAKVRHVACFHTCHEDRSSPIETRRGETERSIDRQMERDLLDRRRRLDRR